MVVVTLDAIRALVVATCAEQGVPVHVTDKAVLARVRALVVGAGIDGGRPAGGRTVGAGQLHRPLRAEAFQGNRTQAEDAWADDRMVEDCLHDGLLPGQGKPRPLIA